MEEELKEMSRQLEALSGAKSRFISARNNLDDMNNNTKTDQPLLVPLSSSLYVPGKIDNPNKVIVGKCIINVILFLMLPLIELGTGYYVEKTVAEAKDLIDRKMQLVNKSIDR
jgi:prefoldin alpha subunit